MYLNTENELACPCLGMQDETLAEAIELYVKVAQVLVAAVTGEELVAVLDSLPL